MIKKLILLLLIATSAYSVHASENSSSAIDCLNQTVIIAEIIIGSGVALAGCTTFSMIMLNGCGDRYKRTIFGVADSCDNFCTNCTEKLCGDNRPRAARMD